jgi:thiazolylpeptide-type bacteriocin precursor
MADLSAGAFSAVLSSELESLEAETFEIQDYVEVGEELMGGCSSTSSTSCCSSCCSCTSCCA